MSLSTQSPSSILVIRSGAVGDFILTTPVLTSLRSAYPDSTLRVAGHPDRIALVADIVDEILDINAAGWSTLFSPDARFDGALAGIISNTDLIVSYIPDSDGVFTGNLRQLCKGVVITHPPHPPDDESLHIVDHLLGALRPIGIDTRGQPTVFLPAPGASSTTFERPYSVIHPGSGGQHKIWPADRFAEVGNRLGEWGPVVITSGPADEGIIACLKPLLPDARFVDPLSLTDLAGLFASARLYIGNDSGPTHLAAAVGTPTISIFGPTDPRTWQPRGARVEVLAAPPDIPPGSRLESIEVDQVLKAANRLISMDI